MKKLLGLFLLFIFMQNINAQKYGYLNKEELYRAMPEYDSAFMKVEKIRSEFENQLAAMQNEFSSKTSSLNNDRDNISEFLRKNRQEELNNLEVRIKLFSVKANSQLEEKRIQIVQPVIDRADNAIKAVALEQGFVFVIDSGQLLYTDEKKCINMLPLVKVKLGVK